MKSKKYRNIARRRPPLGTAPAANSALRFAGAVFISPACFGLPPPLNLSTFAVPPICRLFGGVSGAPPCRGGALGAAVGGLSVRVAAFYDSPARLRHASFYDVPPLRPIGAQIIRKLAILCSFL